MVKQVAQKLGTRKCRRTSLLFVVAVLILAGAQFCSAESIASKNKKGNRLYNQGKYENAEKEYLSAQVDEPGKPEVLYNLGNSLVKQKKYREGVQALGQSIDKGDRSIKEMGWYNKGNALYSAGDYQASADAFIQALKLNPSDRDAKHNLELALTMLKEQQQKKPDKNSNGQESKNPEKNAGGGGKDSRPQQAENNPGSADGNRNKDQQPKPESSQSDQRGNAMTKEQALPLLEAVQNQELKEQRKLLEGRAREKSNGKDW
jgi:Ca-activated chloride channel homolog